ncbi:MAG: sulfurtransferase TusA family protein [Armatimonadota bacterium]|nr:sulfurtransferase TusA family protein [Armatimonadota bacterium]MDR7402211.1 sulfurtransferase TusA family protein [Armatimonadota bacterium]MDR7403339.1 sulfurtransferase TusA family protein [Armatimonadota bacterium]MDR7436967.1 sulfurtransferase TusA family protein [Armatimonadota bacterium]MDR7472259.1 sulfurtransferase TusA family protein [Armatimonadota bacterium]
MELKVDRTIDARGSYCPGPLMELIRAIREARVGEVIEVLSSDSGSKRDIPKWCQKAGHELLRVVDEQGFARFIVRKAR